MPLISRKRELWFREALYGDIAQEILVRRVLRRVASRNLAGRKLHELMVLDTQRLGRVLTLDDVVQTAEADEFYYHEPLVHCAAFSHPDPRSVLLVGCDGGTLREIVKHSVRRIDVVDIDRTVIRLVSEHMPFLPGDSLKELQTVRNPRGRVRWITADGADFVKKVAARGQRYHLVIIDSPDPIGPAKSLFEMSFGLDVAKILTPEGIVIRQTGSSVYQPDEMPSNFRQMQEIFPEVQCFRTAVPSYIGGDFTFVAASHQRGVFHDARRNLKQRFAQFPKGLFRWYSPEMHRAAMVIPPEIVRMVEASEYGRIALIDFSGCDYKKLTSAELLKRFVRECAKEIGMKTFGEALAPDFGHGLSKTAGLSVFQFIETSAITGHVSPHWLRACFDVFTCSALDAKRAVEFSMKFFGAEKAIWMVVPRGKRLFKPEPEIQCYVTVRVGNRLETKPYVYRLHEV